MRTDRRCLKCNSPLGTGVESPFCPGCLGDLGRADWLVAPTPELAAGATTDPLRLPRFGDYELLGEIARGGMGVVYKARQISLDRIVALKMIRAGVLASELDIARFQSEARAAASLRHPGIIAIHEIGEHDDRHFFSMDFVEGRNLADLVREHPLPFRRAAECVRAVAEAIQYAHERGILHRDLKPSNVIVDELDGAHVTDFGLATRIQEASTLTMSGVILGTPSYMAPEQTGGRRTEISAATDVYALGAILFELLTARPPFQGETPLDTIRLVRETEPVSPRRLNPRVPCDLETICLKCLEKEPRRRYATARELAGDLARFLADQPIHARPAQAWERGWKWVRRNPWQAALAGAFVLTGCAALWIGFERAANRELRVTNARVTTAQQAEAAQRHRAEAMQGQLREALDSAEDARDDANRQLYVNCIGLAYRDWEANNLEEAGRRLDACPEKFRHWEWHYLKRLCRPESPSYLLSSNPVVRTAISPDGFHVASLDQKGALRLLDLRTGATQALAYTDGFPVTSLGLTSNLLALGRSGPARDAIRFLNRNDPSDAHTLPVPDTSPPSEAEESWPAARQLLFADEDRLLISAHAGGLVARDRVSGAIRWRLPSAEAHAPSLLAASAGGRAVASATTTREPSTEGHPASTIPQDEVIRVNHIVTGQLLLALTNQTGAIHALALSPDGNTLATGHDGGEMQTWDVASATPMGSLRHGHGTIMALAFAWDGKSLVSGSADGTVGVSSITKGTPAGVRIYRGHSGRIQALAVRSNGTTVVTVDSTGTVQVRDTSAPQDAVSHPDGGRTVGFAGNDHLVTSSGSLYSVRAGTRIRSVIEPPSGGPNMRVSASGEAGLIGLARHWIGLTNGILEPLPGSSTTASYNDLASAFQPGGRYFAAMAGTNIVVSDTRSRQIVSRFPSGIRSNAFIHAFSFGPGDLLAVASGDWNANGLGDVGVPGQAIVLDWRKGIQVASLPTRRFVVWDVKFSPDGRHLATAGGLYASAAARRTGPERRAAPRKQGEVQIWDVGSWREVFDLPGVVDNVFSVDFSPDGKRLVAAVGKTGAPPREPPGEIKLWELERGLEVLSLRPFPGPATGVAFSPDGQRIAAAGSGLLRILSTE